ncbi:MAG: hypothetical protein GEV12_08705 [Micromonosporaceae bacterium]|nr:hypothetical protein [Micromonosporaceae bacterium]
MDFWDVAKLMWRRWYVTLPALLLILAGAVLTGLTVNPDYQVTGHVALVGPAVQRTEGENTVTRINPWSAEALADAATIRLQGKALADLLKAEGYTGEWSALVTGRLPVIRLEVVAERPEQAQATLQRLREAIDLEVRDRQAEYNVAPEEQVTTVDYDGGETVEAVTGKVKRALIVVVGAGLILTTGLVVAYDAIARRRRTAAEEEAGQPEPATGADSAEPPRRPRYQYATAAGTAAIPVAGQPPNGADAPAQVARTARPVQVRYADQPYGDHEYADQPYGEHVYADQPYGEQATAEQSTGWPVSPAAPPGEAPARPPDDSTVVLPLSGIMSGRSGGGRHKPPSDVRTS